MGEVGEVAAATSNPPRQVPRWTAWVWAYVVGWNVGSLRFNSEDLAAIAASFCAVSLGMTLWPVTREPRSEKPSRTRLALVAAVILASAAASRWLKMQGP